MSQVCLNCKATVEGDRFRCPGCGSPLSGTITNFQPRFPAGPTGLAPRPLPPPPEVDQEVPDGARPRRPPKPAAPGLSARRPDEVTRKPPSPAKAPRHEPHDSPVKAQAPAPLSNAPASPGGRAHMPTQGITGFNISKLNIAKNNYHIELPDANGNWVQLSSIVGTVKTPAFGRSAMPRLELMRTVALKHLRFENTSRGLFVEPFDSLNGVFRKINGPSELADGTRFRIGNYIITFRAPEPERPAETLVVEGEHLLARDLKARGVLEFLRPDGRTGVKFPILKASPTVLGRGGANLDGDDAHADIQLAGDPKISLRHAQISFPGPEHHQAILEDLGSKSWTWLHVNDRMLVDDGDVFWLGELIMRVVAAR